MEESFKIFEDIGDHEMTCARGATVTFNVSFTEAGGSLVNVQVVSASLVESSVRYSPFLNSLPETESKIVQPANSQSVLGSKCNVNLSVHFF